MQHKICLVGSGNWGSVIARIIGKNVLQHDSEFDPIINMWVFEELIGDEKLTKIINTRHENVKYLPGYQLPDNVVAIPDLATAATGATLLIFCIPHQFLPNVLTTIKEAGLGKEAMAVSLIKAIDFNEGSIVLISDMIASALQLECSVLMGANVANEVAAGDFCESTLGSKNLEQAAVLKRLFHTDTFRVSVVLDPHGVEMCGALKNVVALGAGFCDGLDYGGNTKSAILRIGLLEMKKLCFKFLDGIKEDTFFESCGIADLITTCFGGRNRKCAEAFVRSGKTWDVIEQELLNGQKLQGTWTCKEVYQIIKEANCEADFPLFVQIYRIAFEGCPPNSIIQH